MGSPIEDPALPVARVLQSCIHTATQECCDGYGDNHGNRHRDELARATGHCVRGCNGAQGTRIGGVGWKEMNGIATHSGVGGLLGKSC